jgi:excisionase family DNA binding protein
MSLKFQAKPAATCAWNGRQAANADTFNPHQQRFAHSTTNKACSTPKTKPVLVASGGQEHLLNRAEAAEYLGVKPQTLAMWACTRSVHLPYVKVGRRARYRYADLVAFCKANTIGQISGEVNHV